MKKLIALIALFGAMTLSAPCFAEASATASVSAVTATAVAASDVAAAASDCPVTFV